MNLILISDLHLLWENPIGRLDYLPDTQFKKLEFILEYAQKNDALILQAGDFFNRPRLWHLLPKVTNMLREYNVPIFSVFGQHDTYFYSDETRASTNLGELEAAGIVHILDNSVYQIGPRENEPLHPEVHLYGASHGKNFDPPNVAGAINILVLHKAIGQTGNEWGSDYNAKSFLNKNKGWSIILCGDIHQKFLVKSGSRLIINTGPILRRTAREYNFHHQPCFMLIRTTRQGFAHKWVEIPHAPAGEVLSRDHIEEPEQQEENIEEFTDGVELLRLRGANVVPIIQAIMDEPSNGVNQKTKTILTEMINADE